MESIIGRNQHETCTEGNYRRANHLGNFHLHKLTTQQSDPEIAAIKADFLVHSQNWDSNFIPYKAAYTLQIGATKEKDNMLEDLRINKSNDWMIKVFYVYPEGSPQAEALLPHRREAFISGSLDDRIAGIKAFISNIGNDANLAAVKTDAQNFLQALEASVQKQEDAKHNLKFLSAGMEPLRIELTTALFASEGALMKKFASNPKKIRSFFDVHAMSRTAKQEDDSVDTKLSPSEIALMDVRFTGDETLVITNKGKGDAAIFFSETSTATAVPADRVLIHPGETVEIDLKTISTDKRFLFGANLSAADEAELSSKLK